MFTLAGIIVRSLILLVDFVSQQVKEGPGIPVASNAPRCPGERSFGSMPATMTVRRAAAGMPTAMQHALKPTLYEQLEALPEDLTGEILNGQLHTQPRPTGPHARAETERGIDIGSAYGRGRGGPGGWWILIEPEIHFVIDQEVIVPDLAGWQKQRMPQIPEGHRFTVVPDWVCEILSPATASKDRELKMPLYAHYGVAHAWLVDPQRRTFEAYGLDHKDWRPLGQASGRDSIGVAPFDALALDLANLWG